MSRQYDELIECGNGPIVDAAMKCEAMFATHKRAMVSISGGADSDAMLDLVERVRTHCYIDVIYVWFDTGIEYKATKDHIGYLEQRYGIHIQRMRARKTVPACCHEYGQPFMSKSVSEFMSRLQRHNFKWEDEPYEILINRYEGCQSALRWWCDDNGSDSRFNISHTRYLKQFIIENPPQFKISNKCCLWSKKRVAQQAIATNHADLNIVGVRKSEGGNRSALNTCVTKGADIDTYRPLFWWTDKTRKDYNRIFNICNSDCYTVYGLKRTGCVGCPYARAYLKELDVMAQFEPNLHKAALKIFGNAYAYTKAYHDYIRCIDRCEEYTIFDFMDGNL